MEFAAYKGTQSIVDAISLMPHFHNLVSYVRQFQFWGFMIAYFGSMGVGRRKNMNPFDDDVSQIYFPLWIYDNLHEENEIEIKDATEEEKKMVKKIIIVALWCIQMRPFDRPSMNKVVEMLEGDFELEMPPKPSVAPREIEEDHGIQ
ncbi:hypothetical protein RD792_013549 [Penstemon davidsonii]|uniref:Glycerophosphodiester phosphodiesterase n=1 Tax=Penstemon davidsonii TaxID=160366 RepID=A0ABR0CUR7_9LAMI|nr:hypothetical protein RD792_013549 [Penstemon davidsonii]